MTTITLASKKALSKTKFKDIKELYAYIVDNSLLTEIGELSENELYPELIKKLEEAKINTSFVDLK